MVNILLHPSRATSVITACCFRSVGGILPSAIVAMVDPNLGNKSARTDKLNKVIALMVNCYLYCRIPAYTMQDIEL